MQPTRLLRVKEVAGLLGLSRSTIYELLNREHLESVHIGSARRVPSDAVERYIDTLRCREVNHAEG
jgi:excisionase family DNA binding protein